MITDKVNIKGKKFAILLRRSEGETGSTKAQLDRIKRDIDALEKRTGRKINRTIVGKDINKKRRFNAARDLAIEGDIYNEGEGASGFKTAERPVLAHLLKLVEQGKYDGVAMESFDRLSRDILGLAAFALPLWRQDGKIFIGFNGDYLDSDRENEYLKTIVSAASSLSKVGEIEKGKEALFGDAVSRGFLKGSQPSFLGDGSKIAGVDYRRAYALMKAYGENPRTGKVNNQGLIEREFNASKNWADRWYQKMKQYEQLGVLEDWLTSVEEFNKFIDSFDARPSQVWKKNQQVLNAKKSAAGFFAYPAGVKIEETQEFVKFPVPSKIGFDKLGEFADPTVMGEFVVERKPYENEPLQVVQTQPRSRAKR